MSLASKGLRRISVDGGKYVWKVSLDSGYFTVVVKRIDLDGAVAAGTFAATRKD